MNRIAYMAARIRYMACLTYWLVRHRHWGRAQWVADYEHGRWK